MPHVRLASKMCETCVVRPEMHFDLAVLRKRWGSYGHQICHQFRVKGQRHCNKDGTSRDVWCRGFWERELDAQTRKILTESGLVEIVPQCNAKEKRL